MESETTPTQEGTNKYTIPVAIVIAGALIAGALYYTNRPAPSAGIQGEQTQREQRVPEVTAKDHILGNPDAEIIIVEYSDYECPFCKVFHETMHSIIDEYGPSGKVAWVYRQFPIVQLHPKALEESRAGECAAEVGGNDGFWKFTDRLFEVTPSNNGLDLARLPVIAQEVGLNVSAFQECLASTRYKKEIEDQVDSLFAMGANGTPFMMVMYQDQQAPILGAQPLEAMRRVVNTLLDQSGTQSVPVVPVQ
jgi:protein-disulfide isomerase